MLRSPNSRQSALNVDNYRTLSELGMRSPTSTRTSRQLSSRQDDEDDNNRTIRKLVSHQPMNPSRNYSSSTTSLKSMVIDGRWKYRVNDGSDDDNDEVDRLRLQSLGIENLVRVCHDIMRSKTEISHRKDDRRAKSPVTSNGLPVIRLDAYKKLTSADRSALNRAHLFDLMTIVFEAASTDVSMGQLVRIWREASEQARKPRPLERSTESQPLISYVQAINQLIRTPNDHILQIAIHASLVTVRKRSDLLRLGNKLGIDKNEFDIRSIHSSFQAFQYMVQF